MTRPTIRCNADSVRSLAWANRSIVPEEGVVRMFVERQHRHTSQPWDFTAGKCLQQPASNMQRSAECKLRTESLGLFTQLRSVIPSYLILFYCCIPFADQARFVVFVYTILLLCTHGLASHLTYLRVVWMPILTLAHTPHPHHNIIDRVWSSDSWALLGIPIGWLDG